MREIIINCDIGISGHVTIKQKEKVVYDDHNTITNVGLSEVCYAMLDKNNPIDYIAVGDDDSNSTPSEIALQTQLKNEKNRNNLIGRIVEQEIDLNYIYKMNAEFSGKNGEGTPNLKKDIIMAGVEVKEVGLFNRYTSGEMIARIKKFPSFMFDFDSTLNIEWKLKANIQDLTVNGGVVRTGSEIICKSLLKFDADVNNDLDYYQKQNSTSDFTWTPHPWGLNLVSLGTGTNPTTLDMTDLDKPENDYDAPPTITRLDLTGEASDVNYNPKVIIQRYIPLNSIPFDIKEAGLFNYRKIRYDNVSAINTIQKMFSRVILPAPILSNKEAVLTWIINFKRGS